ncbi:MAG: ATP-binding protein [Candidatus Melainabacteria bacterium]|nr:ATP-binding protein [Candidatus Melainabacteria bacterium]
MKKKQTAKQNCTSGELKGAESSCTPFLEDVKNARDKFTILERAITSARNGIVITDPNQEDNPITYVNPSFLELTGYSQDEVINHNCRFLQGNDRDQEGLRELRKAIQQGTAITVVLRNYRKDNSLFWNELTVSPVHDESGRLINFIGIQNDITARTEAEKRISEFYSKISHELRTPLSSIRTALSLLKEGNGGPMTSGSLKLVEIAGRNTSRLLRLVNDILDFRKIEAGKMELRLEETAPAELIDQVLGELEATAKDRNITFEIIINCDDKMQIDRDRIAQVLSNLTVNAIKFSPTNGKVKIHTIKNRDGFICFRVIDRGQGIAKSDFGKLFQKFQQIDSSDTRAPGGTGLGLSISKSLVESHGGEIGVDSKVGRGSIFWFEIPVKRSE